MKIITSNSSHGAYVGVLKELKPRIRERNIVIAPDRFTASVERGLIESLQIESTFGIEVMSFTRLADRLLGGEIKKCLTPEGSVMLIGKVIADNRDKLRYYGKVALTEGFASELYAALTAVRNSGVSTEQLKENMPHLSPSLRAKTHDIALIYEGYLAALEGRHSDSSTRLYALAAHIEAHPDSVATTNFYCTDIYDFSAPELAIISGLAKHAMSFTVGVTSGYDNPNRRIYPDRIIAKLKAACADKVSVERNDEVLPPPIEAISSRLFSYRAFDDPAENGGKVVLRRARDMADEALALAVDIIAKVREGGRFRDFEVFVSDIGDYEAELKSVFARYGIPFFIDKKELLIEQTKVRYVLEALACVRSGFRRRETIDFVKNPLFAHGVEGGEESVYLFENYALKYNIDRSRFQSEFKLKATNKANFKNNSDSVDENAVPENVRRELLRALSGLMSKGEENISFFTAAVRRMLDEAESAWNSHVEKLSSLSQYYRKCAEQVDKKLLSVLDEIDAVLDMPADIAQFESIFKAMLKTLKIALVPTYLDCVFVGDYDSRFMGGGDIYVLGATNDKLPRASKGGAVITPGDEEYFARIGIDITPNARQKLFGDMYAVCDLFKKPRGRLVVSYAQTGGEGALRPSTVVSELKAILNEDDKALCEETISFDNMSRMGKEGCEKLASAVFATPKSCYYEVLSKGVSGKAAAGEPPVYGSAYECMDEELKSKADGIYAEPDRISLPDGAYFASSTSVSRLETFFTCPYSHYFNYILSLRKRKDGKAEGTENGTVLHYVLERFFKDIRDGNITDENEIAQKAYAYFDDAIKENDFEVLLEKPETGRLLARVKEEGARVCGDLYKIYLRSSFKPAMLEAKIGEGGISPMSLTVGERKIALKGIIDRVDVLDDKFIIVDYKTYRSADLTLKELYYGQKIQLYIYMKAVERSLGAKPVGVFYIPIFAGFTEDGANRYKYKGQICDSLETMSLIDGLAGTPDSVLPYKATKSGLNNEVHLSQGDFDKLGNYALSLAQKGAEEIASCYIKPAPVKDACKRCRFAEICAYRDMNERRLSKVTMSSFDGDCAQSGEI